MYKLLLSWRYLKTRFIALASIVSVTLGVATLIVVNSVMAGFVDQMKSRLHGILSDVEISAPMLGEIDQHQYYLDVVRDVIGDDLDELTCVVRVPALISFDFHGRQWAQQIMLLGIDDETFGKVTDFEPYLTNEIKRNGEFSFQLENGGYGEKFKHAGWDYRRHKIETEREFERFRLEQQQLYDATAREYFRDQQPDTAAVASESVADSVNDKDAASDEASNFALPVLPERVPDLDVVHAEDAPPMDALDPVVSVGNGHVERLSPFDSRSEHRPQVRPEDMFDPMKDQHTGIILGIAISARKTQLEDGTIDDIYLVRPGDDVQVMFPTVGSNAQPVPENCTIVDFYSSNMHEYDSSFAFMPLSELQKSRGMVDPLTGDATISSIQIKLKPGTNLDEVRDKLIAQFPPDQYAFDIRTWQDTQRPLLSAVNMELTILNILLFLIIAVAGFGILATFYMIVVEKTKDIGILKALGAPSRGVMSIFLGYGVSLGTVGTGAGIILGLTFVRYINQIADFVGVITGQEVFDPTIYYFSSIPTIISPFTILWVALGAISIAVFASVLPALRAARLHPVEALRYE